MIAVASVDAQRSKSESEALFYLTWNVFSYNAIGIRDTCLAELRRFIYGTCIHHLIYASIFFLDVNYGLALNVY